MNQSENYKSNQHAPAITEPLHRTGSTEKASPPRQKYKITEPTPTGAATENKDDTNVNHGKRGTHLHNPPFLVTTSRQKQRGAIGEDMETTDMMENLVESGDGGGHTRLPVTNLQHTTTMSVSQWTGPKGGVHQVYA